MTRETGRIKRVNQALQNDDENTNDFLGKSAGDPDNSRVSRSMQEVVGFAQGVLSCIVQAPAPSLIAYVLYILVSNVYRCQSYFRRSIEIR